MITCLGAGSAAIACMRLLLQLGACRENIYMLDRRGVVYEGREGVNVYKQEFASRTDKRSLADAVSGADVFIGLSGADLLTPAMLRSMAERPIVFACSNPDPEIEPAVALAHGAAIAADGKGINNLLGFPGLFKGALAARAPCFTDAMLLAAAGAIADLAQGDDLVPDPLDRGVHQAVAEAVSRSSRSGA